MPAAEVRKRPTKQIRAGSIDGLGRLSRCLRRRIAASAATGTPSTGTIVTWRTAPLPSIGTSATPLSAPSSENTYLFPPASSWSAAATPEWWCYGMPGFIEAVRLAYYLVEIIDVMIMSEDMVMDGYVSISNIDISSVVIEMMIKKYEHIPQLECILLSVPIISFANMLMDARDMTFFNDESFDCVMDKGTLDSLMCGVDAPLSASRMLEEINRLLRLGGIYMLITYGDPSVRIPYINQPGCNWEITLYILGEYGPTLSLMNNLSNISFVQNVKLIMKQTIHPFCHCKAWFVGRDCKDKLLIYPT
ncbi:hypothetical protein ZIOFF_014968 [Zingiber officinale]|uniref:Methyltransferase type 11 domain-containing protein n=1 Tax=Zingiber officinale TaxID=94328 RepID=A0A8J5LVY3_ZINOF|nr:hypothetical protein ZIOFF_014968 [Zingiber officinale]